MEPSSSNSLIYIHDAYGISSYYIQTKTFPNPLLEQWLLNSIVCNAWSVQKIRLLSPTILIIVEIM